MNDDKALRWPILIILSIFVIIGAAVYTVIFALDHKVQMSHENMMSYHQKDKNINKIIKAKIEFDKLYNLNKNVLDITKTKTDISFKLTDKNSNPVDGAEIKLMITRPDNHDYDLDLNVSNYSDGIYTFDSIILPQEGRWNIMIYAKVNDNYRYKNFKLDTRNPNSFEY